jgi:diguanylate cyclase (GGDEF)-like protein
MKPNEDTPDILIVDDDHSIIKTLNIVLKDIGKIHFAYSASNALKLIKDHIEPDIILLDVDLLDGSGLDICAKLKSNSITKEIPVLFITSHAEMGFEETVFNLGAADYIVKPLNPLGIAARVQIHLNYQKAIRRLENLAHIDGLTGIANRRHFDNQLAMELGRAQRENIPLTVALIDIDEFKKYNDHFGHTKGDNCLKKVASILSCNTKRPGDVTARYGGEEFAYILPNTNQKGAEHFLQTTLHAIQKLNILQALNAIHPVVTVSIGFSTYYPKKNKTINDNWDIVEEADTALYESKRKGRNCIKYKGNIEDKNKC